MANKNDLFDFDETTAANNDNIQGANIAENCAPSGINNAIRGLASIVKRALGSQGSAIASAPTTAIGAPGTALYATVTGTTTITSFGTVGAGTFRIVEFTGTLTLTHNATSLRLPGATNIQTAAGDVGFFISLGSGNWKCLHFSRADGKAVVSTVQTADLANDAVTYAKMQNVSAASRLLGRGSAGGAGSPEEISLGAGLSMSGTSLSVTGARLLQRFHDQVIGPQGSGTHTIPDDNTVPLNTEGTQVFSRSIVPQSASSRIHISGVVHYGASTVSVGGVLALFRGTTCIATFPADNVSSAVDQIAFDFEEDSGGTSPRTYSIRFGTNSGTSEINDHGGSAGTYGNTIVSNMTTEEWL